MSRKDIVLAMAGGVTNTVTAGDQPISILSSMGQTLAGLVTAHTQARDPRLALRGAIAVNPLAGLITLVKVSVDISDGQISVGDAVSILGNSLSVAAAVCAVVPGGQPLALGLVTVGRALQYGGIGLSLLDVNYPLRGPGIGTVSNSIGTTPDPLVKTIRYVDPLILDLDGDGFEITPLAKGILFDANGDTIKTGTAWASADDGILVWDRNSNGLIDSGQELFGDETILANGKKAAHGFAALSELDKGSVINGVTVGAADSVFDGKDSHCANLRIWRDLNQDGISQADELKSLAETGVTSINLRSSSTNSNYGDAILVQKGTYIRADGSSGQAGSFILAQNNFVRQFAPITVSDVAKGLPDLKGSGWVRDFREAATLNPELVGLLHSAENEPTRAGYKDAVARLLREWGNDSGYSSASKQALIAGYGLILSDPADAQEAGWMEKAIKATEADRNAYRATLSAADLSKFDAMRERMAGGWKKFMPTRRSLATLSCHGRKFKVMPSTTARD